MKLKSLWPALAKQSIFTFFIIILLTPINFTVASGGTCAPPNIQLSIPIFSLAQRQVVSCVANFQEYLNLIYELAIEIATLGAILMIIYSGLRYITSQGDPTALEDAKNRIVSAITGLILLILAFLILQSLK